MLLLFMAIFLIAGVSALDFENQQRWDFGHVVIFSNLSTMPTTLEPGVPGAFKMAIENNGESEVRDLRVELNLPSEIGFFNDVSKKKISRLFSGDVGEISFDLIALPGSSEGIYEANLTSNYVNRIGEERTDSYTISIVVKSKPQFYVQIDDADVYKGKNLGEITVKFVNNDVADIKFLTVELQDSEDYTILSPRTVYVGDLDSDDFESVDYRIKVNKRADEIYIPLKIYYKDSLNNPMSDDVGAVLTMHSGKDLGKVTSNTTQNIIIGVVVLGVGYWIFRKWKKKKKREKY